MSLATLFLSAVAKASTDLDIDRLREDVHTFALRHPDLTTKEKAWRLVNRTAKKAAAVGAVASLPPGWGAFVAIGPELTTLIVLQSRMILGLHLLYGGVPEPNERALEVLAGLATGAGINVGRRLTTRAAEEIAMRLASRIAGRSVSHLVPVFGALAAGVMNYGAVRAVGMAAIARVERAYGPPEIPGRGPVIEVKALPGSPTP